MNRPNQFVSLNLLSRLILAGLAFALMAQAGCGFRSNDSNAYRMEGDALYRGSGPYRLRAIETERLGNPGLGILSQAAILNRICRSGGNTVIVDLPPAECVTGSPISVWLSGMAGLVEETRKRSMGLILRASDNCVNSPGDLAAYLADAFGENRSVLLWIEGERAAEVLAGLRAAGSENVLISADPAADLVLAASGGPAEPRSILLNPPEIPADGSHFALSFERVALDRLEAVFGAREQVYAGPPDSEGFLPLFDGKSLQGWRATGQDPAGWAVEEGTIVWKHRGGGRLTTLGRFSDFILRLEWKIDEGRNSGLFIRCPAAGRESRIGMELQIFGDHGTAPHRNGTGAIYDVMAPRANPSRPAGEWNEMEVECRGAVFRVILNGETVQDLRLDLIPELSVRLQDGFIALQDHGDPVAFRNIRVKPLAE